MSKICTTCEVPKALEDFPIQKAGKFGRLAVCKECHRGATARRYKYESSKERSLKRNYGISLEEFNHLKIKQESKCAICGKVTETLHVDHDHTTGSIRGLLCNGCNLGIGLLGDTYESVQKALEYLGSGQDGNAALC